MVFFRINFLQDFSKIITSFTLNNYSFVSFYTITCTFKIVFMYLVYTSFVTLQTLREHFNVWKDDVMRKDIGRKDVNLHIIKDCVSTS